MTQETFDFENPNGPPKGPGGPDGAGGQSPSGDALTLAQYAQQAYLEYALSVVKGRALPSYSDGQKPVQRRILFTMERLGLGFTGTTGARAVKSARVVGEVLGKYHPHGDQAAYDAMVRMAQDFSQRYPLVDGQGNFGSRDGDNAAAMRYTEARLSAYSRLLLDELDQGTVDFQPNYDGSESEPRELPARLPFVLLNGASGIAVGMATEIPSHNLREVAEAAVLLLKRPDASDDELFGVIKGPDYPGGGQLISSADEIRAAYSTGRGSLKVRARWKIEDLARGQWQLVVTELPQGVSTAKVLEEIEELTNPKVKTGKKTLTPEQLQLKGALLAVLDKARDESNKDAPVRLVFEPKSRTVDQQDFVNTLLAQTSLETTASLNLTMIGDDGRPTQKTLRKILTEWVGFRLNTVTRRTQHRLDKVRDRIHILEGRHEILLHIDEVIALIRHSDEPKPALIERFKLSERQAEDILEIRLRQLARLEFIKIEQELKTLREEAGKLEEILSNPSVLRRTVVKEIEADAKQYGDDRRTEIKEDKRAVAEVRIVDEPVTVVVSLKGWVRALKGHEVDPAALAFKSGDSLYGVFPCRSVDPLVVLGTNGRAYSVPVSALPGGRGDGQPITTLIELESGTQIAHYYAAAATQKLLLAGTGGFGLVAEVGDLVGRQKAGKSFLSLEGEERPLPPSVVPAAAAKGEAAAVQVACLTMTGRLLTFAIEELKHQPKGGRGLTLIDLDPKDALVSIAAFTTLLMVSGTVRGGKAKEEPLRNAALAAYAGKRAKKGKPCDVMTKPMRVTAG